MENKETVNQENKAVIGDQEILESEMTEDQKYFANQITDLRNKQAKLKFDMDQIHAALQVFQNQFITSTQEVSKELLSEETSEGEK